MTRFDGPQGMGGMPPRGPQPGMDPDAYAQQYANTNGISLEEAKSQLKAKFGDPQKPVSTFAPNNITGVSTQQLQNTPLLSFANDGKATYNIATQQEFTYNPGELKNANPAQLSAFVRYGMQETGLSEKEFAEMIGLPTKQKPDENTAKQLLRELGIPDSIIEKGDKAIKKYAHDNHINLPPRERK